MQRKRERSEPESWSETTRKYLSEDNKGSSTDHRKERKRQRKREEVRETDGKKDNRKYIFQRGQRTSV